MEILFKIATFTLLFLIIASPVFVIYTLQKLNLRQRFITYIISGIVITFVLTIILGWWSSFSNNLLLTHYGFDFEAMNDAERFENVTAENLEHVKILQRNMLGVGWPLKVLMSYTLFS